MDVFSLPGPMKISASGLSAERVRMEVIANNIANANTTRTEDGGPYERRRVIFETVLHDAANGNPAGFGELQGVRVAGIQRDSSDPILIYQPGHPDANPDGYVSMPNINLANEMVDLITANRGYEANLRVMRSFREMIQQTLVLLK
jgi:flagellar basal-body rod protein FlgC